jgi:hypothetical protein
VGRLVWKSVVVDLRAPPKIDDGTPLAVLPAPPLTEARMPLAVLR